ncbi:MAG: DeoR/GlpR transcriptional regulator [Ruminococcaceae bacterium]|nr:DeoR/GlpR transcriptional regulator [Oscillospiraceae bacterium]
MNYPRRGKVKEILVSQPFTSLKELQKKFPEVSCMTLRRDIEFFEQQGEVIKVRGGARAMKFITTTMEQSFSERMSKNTDTKRKIAKEAVGALESGRSIFLDSGTTAMELASLVENKRLSIITSGPNVAVNLSRNDKVMVHLLGGILNRDNLSISGAASLDYINKINIDVAIIVPSGFSVKDGFTCGNYNECELKEAIIKKAGKTIMLLAASKINKSLPYTFCKAENVSTVITDEHLDDEVTKYFEDNKIELIIAK